MSQDATKMERPFILNVVFGLESGRTGNCLLIAVHMASATALRVVLRLLRTNVSLLLKKCVEVTESR